MAIAQILRTPDGRRELAVLYSLLGYWHSRVLASMVVPRQKRQDRMLTVDEAAEICHRSRAFLYERSEALGFGHRNNGARGLRISESELRRWMLGK